MANTGRNRFNFERHYFGNMRTNNVEGSVAKAVDAVEEYEEDYYKDENLFTEEYTESDFESTSPAKRKSPREYTNTPGTRQNEKTKQKTLLSFGFLEVLMIVILIAALAKACYVYIQARADIIQMNKKITTAKDNLKDIQNKNAALESQLDVETDRNYIYTVAVSKLNMIYPKENDTIYYNKPYEGYVRQYYEIPSVK